VCFGRIDWNRAVLKTYYEIWPSGHLLVKLNCIESAAHLTILVLRSIECHLHMSAEARQFFRFDVVRNGAWGCGIVFAITDCSRIIICRFAN
jgi:hypothetical protein